MITMITRRTCLGLMAGALATSPILYGKDNDAMRELLEAALNEKKGVTLYIKGATIPGTVVKIAGEIVELRSREYSRIVVRIDSIDVAAMS